MNYIPRNTLGCLVIVVEPLIYINEEAIKRLLSLSFTATYIDRDINETTDICYRQFTFLFTSAENIVLHSRFVVSKRAI